MITITDIKFPKFIEWSSVPVGSSLYADLMRNRVELYGTTPPDAKESVHDLLEDVHASCNQGCVGLFAFDKESYSNDEDGSFKLTIFFEDAGDMAGFAKGKLVTVRLVA